MAEFGGIDEIELFNPSRSSFRSNSALSGEENDQEFDERFASSQWVAIERLPTFERIKSSIFDEANDGNGNGLKTNAKGVVDVTKLDASEKHLFMERLIRHIENDNLKLLQEIRKRIDRVGVKLPAVEVRYHDLRVEAECEVVDGKPLPTLWNSFKSSLLELTRLLGLKAQTSKISIIDGVSGVIKPARMTLLLGPPGCGKTSFLKALSGNLDNSLKVTGEISYNGYKLSEFVPQKTCAYISQYDLHIPEMTVRETVDFSACCQGIGRREEIMVELSQREKEARIFPDPDIDIYMKAISVEGKRTTLQTDYILKILGLDICADTIVGDALRRGISGGEKKRLTTGEMIVGPTQTLFMDEISNGLDSSTTHQIVACLQHLAHIAGATILVSLLQPAPETFDLFDDIVLMAKGKTIYHGPRTNVLEFFESCGFRCPERKGVADFLQEVISEKDQAQYWTEGRLDTYIYIPVATLSRKFEESDLGKLLSAQISLPFEKSKDSKHAINFSSYSLPKWTLFKSCISRELLLMKRNSFVYVHKTIQLFVIASMTMTVFLRRTDFNLLFANYYMGALFFALVILVIDGLPELSMTVARLPVFYKQRDLYFYPAWAYAIPSAVLKIPLSLLESAVWTSITYFGIGYSPDLGRFFYQVILLFALHFTSISMYRFLASICRTVVATTFAGSLSMLLLSLFSGFLIPRSSMPIWLKWGFWASPMTYGEIGLALNEFLAPRWEKMLPSNSTVGRETLEARGLNFDKRFLWISVGVLFGFTLLFNVGFTLALTFLHPVGSRAIISREKLSQTQRSKRSSNISHAEEMSRSSSVENVENCHKGRIILPFEPLTVVFQDLQYYVGAPTGMKEHGFDKPKLQLLRDITGALKPGVLTALMGVSGAGKTTLLDVLAGRKTRGTIEGEIKIGGYPKVQKTFARISGYCEQVDIHSPQITVEESLVFSAWLRLDPQIDAKTKSDFVKQVLETIELEGSKDHLVGVPGISGLSTEQRKRLTIAVELVANPSIIFLDEPTTGLDARAASIVMRAVKNVADTGRTIVCTIHQPSIHIFEKFDELILLKPGGRMTYYGPLGRNSCKVIEYFEGISGVPKIKNNYNPATWMLEVTSTSSEAELGVDFADIYRHSALYVKNKEMVAGLSKASPGSMALDFPTSYSQTDWEQFKACLWKHHWSYWRSPEYNLMRFWYMLIVSLVFGFLYWDQGKNLDNQQSLFSVFGSMYMAVFFCGVNNCASVFPYINTERAVFYRERFAGMYTSWAYAIAQVMVEIPYIFAQTLEFTVITYPMIGYYMSAYKIFWYFYSMFCTLLYFNYLGMMIVALSPSFFVAANLQSGFLIVFNLFAGYLVPQPQFPKWWNWLYHITPTAWTLNGMLTSQYGDINQEIEVFGETKTVAVFLRDYFGFHHNRLPLVAFMSILFPITFASVFAYCIGNLNYQKR